MSELEHITFLLQEYCANILGPFKTQLQHALQKAGELKIQRIMTAHGCSWRGDSLGVVLKEYDQFAYSKYPNPKISVIYDSTSSQTELAARCVAEGMQKTCQYAICDLSTTDLTQVAYHASTSAGLAFGSHTLNGRLSYRMEACIRYLKGL